MRESESRWDSMVQTIDEETQLETKTWRCWREEFNSPNTCYKTKRCKEYKQPYKGKCKVNVLYMYSTIEYLTPT